jgi:hypothetical protein
MSSVEFWFGAAVLCTYQVAKFNELSALDPALSARFADIPGLRANDLAGRSVFATMLTVFLAVSFVIYFLLCYASPTVLLGWARVSGATDTSALETFLKDIPYPLYIAAAFMGLTQPAVPIFSNLGNMQRNLFHAWMGVPRRVVNASNHFANQILARSPNARQRGEEIARLASDPWMERIDAYADTVFYGYHLHRLKLDNEAERRDLLNSSERELRNLLGQLVYAASIATVRESGTRSLDRLAADLKVSTPPKEGSAKDLLAGAILFVFGITFLWFLIPMFHGLSVRLLSAGTVDLWPKDLAGSGQYVMAQAVPMFLATAIAMSAWASAVRRAAEAPVPAPITTRSIEAHLQRYGGVFATILAVILLYDLCQAFFDYGNLGKDFQQGFWVFVVGQLPFFLLHSFISVVMCFVLLLYVDRIGVPASGPHAGIAVLTMTIGVALASAFYAVSRTEFRLEASSEGAGVDFTVLVVLINVAAALLSFATAALYCRRQIAVFFPAAAGETAGVPAYGAAAPAPARG